MTSISFTIPGRIAGKARGRAVADKFGRITVYTAKKTRSHEALVRHFAAQAMRGVAKMEGPVELHVNMWLNPPPSWSKKKRGITKWITGKPDCDNVLKLLSDAMNHIVYTDDLQIARVSFVRRYTMVPEHIYVRVQTLDEGALDVPSTRAPDEPDMGQEHEQAKTQDGSGLPQVGLSDNGACQEDVV